MYGVSKTKTTKLGQVLQAHYQSTQSNKSTQSLITIYSLILVCEALVVQVLFSLDQFFFKVNKNIRPFKASLRSYACVQLNFFFHYLILKFEFCH